MWQRHCGGETTGNKPEEEPQAADEWQAKAKAAIERGDEDLAGSVLSEKRSSRKSPTASRRNGKCLRKTSDSLKADFRRLEEKLEEARRKRDVLVARKLAAEAQKDVASVAPAMSKAQRSFSKFDRMESKIEQMEAEARRSGALGRTAKSGQGNCRSRAAAEVDAELAALKAEADKKKDGNQGNCRP